MSRKSILGNKKKSEETHVNTGFIYDMSETQKEKLEEFRTFVNNPRFNDRYLLRFLRARKFDMEKTQEMWKNNVQWRIENEVDSIQNFQMEEMQTVREAYPHGYCGIDKQGRPIYIDRVGLINFEKLFTVTSEERMMKYYIASYESLNNQIIPKCDEIQQKIDGKYVDQTFVIIDLKGFSLSHFNAKNRNLIKLSSKIAQDNYPENLGKLFIINAPMFFGPIWSAVKLFLDPKTQKKINIFGSNYKKDLLAEVDADQLPKFLGGTKDDNEIIFNKGPWNLEGEDILSKSSLQNQQLSNSSTNNTNQKICLANLDDDCQVFYLIQFEYDDEIHSINSLNLTKHKKQISQKWDLKKKSYF